MLKIEENWPTVSESIRTAAKLVSNFGYNRDTLTSSNAVIPISYYILRNGLPSRFLDSADYSNDRKLIQKWLILSLLKRVFSGQPDSVLNPIRQIMKNGGGTFPLMEITQRFRGEPKSIAFSSDDLANLFLYQYGDSYTFSTLALMYPSFDLKNKFHVDHIFPKSFFKAANLTKMQVPETKHTFYLSHFNDLANLQLLEGAQNEEKSNSDFGEWLGRQYPESERKRTFSETHCIPTVDLSFTNFEEFLEKRRELMSARFNDLLGLEAK